MVDNSRAINRVFTRKVLDELLVKGSNEIFDYVVKRYINAPESKTHEQIFSEIYVHLGKENRNEYYYMNTLLDKLLVGIHSVNTTTALSQVHIGQHIADFVMLNGEGQVYEIKSDLDSFDRLYDQLCDYFTAFSKVSVLASINEHEKLQRVLSGFGVMGNAVGIYVLSGDDTIFSRTRSREPSQFNENLNHTSIFKLLRKREYESIIQKYFGELPKVAPVFHFRACLEQFEKIPILEAQKSVTIELKKRNTITKTDFSRVQNELKSVVYFSCLYRKLPILEDFLRTSYGAIL
jgi:hypothetical protein